tara:strand:+ start:218 stop:868 length:651 start_codon:yes stop_codon:yes gene_type:complete
MARFIQKPVYTPESKIRGGLFTQGKEWMYADTLKEYVGLYHKYPNEAVYTEAAYYPLTSKPIIAYVEQSAIIPILDEEGNSTGDETANNSLYYQITEKRFNNYYTPPYYYPEPSPEIYDVGFMLRYFAQRINVVNDITEINPDEFDRKNTGNQPGIDEQLYNFVKIKWTIDGPLKEVRTANARVIAHEEINKNMLGLGNYLTDLDEFHKNRHKVPE